MIKGFIVVVTGLGALRSAVIRGLSVWFWLVRFLGVWLLGVSWFSCGLDGFFMVVYELMVKVRVLDCELPASCDFF